MFGSLHPPADLASARARLLAVSEALTADALDPARSILHLDRRPGPGWGHVEAGVQVVVADLVLWAAPLSHLRALTQALGPERSLLFLEPTAEVGWRGAAHRVGRSLWRTGYGHDFASDVPAQLRQAGLMVTDLNRFGVGPAGIRCFVMARADTPGWP